MGANRHRIGNCGGHALGWADFGGDDFEEIMSTHYGRMVHLDDRTLLFANPEDAAEYIGFDPQPVEQA